jgi:hypothetical protein
MRSTIFFSWQSDRPSGEGRNFIEECLQAALKNLSYDVEFQGAVRGGVEVESDVKNTPGTPRIFQTILNKIQRATLFVPDFTFVATRANGDPTPNPNVLIEYGYALKCIGENRIVSVMNSAYGAPSRETMPFDLIEHQHPITYSLAENADEAARKSEGDRLTKAFESALKIFFESDEYRNTLPKPEPIAYREPKDGRARFRRKGDPIGVRSDVFAHLTGAPQDKVFLSEGPSMWFRVGPQSPPLKPHKITELEAHVTKLALLPFYEPGSSFGGVRGADGCGFYNNVGPEATPSLVYVFSDGEVWAINTMYLSIRPDLIFFDEDRIVKSLEQCVDFLKGLGISGPYRLIAGLEGILDRHLQEDTFRRKRGLCLVDVIEWEGSFKTGDSAKARLEPFFEEVFERCGLTRPAKVSVA